MEKEEILKQKEYIEKVKKINTNQNLKYTIYTMGCKLNENDSEKICGMLEEMGYSKTENFSEANFIVFNTCCVRENAEEKLFGKLGEVKKIKEKNNIIISIGGCMMQEPEMLEKIKSTYKFVDIVFGTHTMHELPQNIYDVLIKQNRIRNVIDIDGKVYEGLPIKRENNFSASVTIMYGCNNFCTYCIVPYVRGRERSRNPEEILNEIKELAKEGYKEITLLGQNVNSYLVADKQKYNHETVNSFATLLREINKINGIERIRFISPHPKDFTDDVIEAIRDCEKVCKIIHLPLQSGSTEVLNKMNRKYSKEQYLSLVQKMKEKIPNVLFSTDIIVGFPEETEENFEDTLDVANKVNFEQIFMFIYSRRKGTVADKMENQVNEETKHKRFDKLKKLYEERVSENNNKFVNTVQKVLVEGKSKNNEDVLTGRNEFNKVICFKGNKDLIGKLVNVKIIEEHKWYLEGEEIK